MLTRVPQRSALYVPASNQRAVDKSATIDADWIIYDLEDSVSDTEKATARQTLTDAFSNRQFGGSNTAIRSNAVASESFLADLKTASACAPDAILIPKVESVSDVERFHNGCAEVDIPQQTNSWFMIETANGITRLGEIIESARSKNCRLTTLVVGHNDIASETGVSLESDRQYLIPWLMQIVLHAKANDLQVLDSVWNNFRDLSGFEREAEQGKQMGFDGKTLIHPSQVDVATRIFSPSQEEVRRARLIVENFSRADNQHKNVLSIEGEMVERLHLLQAEKLLIKAGH